MALSVAAAIDAAPVMHGMVVVNSATLISGLAIIINACALFGYLVLRLLWRRLLFGMLNQIVRPIIIKVQPISDMVREIVLRGEVGSRRIG